MRVHIREETFDDIDAIRSMTEAAFRDAEHTSHTEQFINYALRNSGKLTLSLVAVDKGQIIGHVAISPVTLSDATADWYGLGPLAVSPVRQREGIGSRLVHRALEKLREQGARGCVVLGEPAYYGRFGFQGPSSLVLTGVPPEYFQALCFVGPMPVATVRYHDSFNA